VESFTAAVSSVRNYCEGVQQFVTVHEPVLFAADDTSQYTKWRQLTPQQWEQAGKPLPAALAWLRGGQLVAVKLALVGSEPESNPIGYCFWGNGNLARMSVEPRRMARQLSAAPSRVIARGVERLYAEDGSRKILDMSRADQPALQSEQTYYAYPNTPEFRTVGQLPFTALLSPGT
jgi:hypothetical protein